MVAQGGPGETGRSGPGSERERTETEDQLDRRLRDLDAKIAARRTEDQVERDRAEKGVSGYGQALKLSSEFVAGVIVGAGLGWIIDYAAGTSPWGLIVFLLLGFGAGVLNVMRAAGKVAEFGQNKPGGNGS